jgi:hypothetical protein
LKPKQQPRVEPDKQADLEVKLMKRINTLACFGLLALAAGGLYKTAALSGEKTIILRVRSAERGPVSFSGSYRSEESDALKNIVVRNSFFGLKMKTESLTGSMRAESGSPDLFVELIEFTGNRETASMTGKGRAVEFEAQPTDVGNGMSMRVLPVE